MNRLDGELTLTLTLTLTRTRTLTVTLAMSRLGSELAALQKDVSSVTAAAGQVRT